MAFWLISPVLPAKPSAAGSPGRGGARERAQFSPSGGNGDKRTQGELARRAKRRWPGPLRRRAATGKVGRRPQAAKSPQRKEPPSGPMRASGPTKKRSIIGPSSAPVCALGHLPPRGKAWGRAAKRSFAQSSFAAFLSRKAEGGGQTASAQTDIPEKLSTSWRRRESCRRSSAGSGAPRPSRCGRRR